MVEAPGWPGIPARWTSSAKDGVGAALSEGSRVWFTIAMGSSMKSTICVLTRLASAISGSSLLTGILSSPRSSVIAPRIEDGVPAFRLTSAHRGGRFRLIIPDLAEADSRGGFSNQRNCDSPGRTEGGSRWRWRLDFVVILTLGLCGRRRDDRRTGRKREDCWRLRRFTTGHAPGLFISLSFDVRSGIPAGENV
jgi:hypothetical protein